MLNQATITGGSIHVIIINKEQTDRAALYTLAISVIMRLD